MQKIQGYIDMEDSKRERWKCGKMKEKWKRDLLKKETVGHKTGVNQSRGAVDQSYLNKESGERKKYKRKSGNQKLRQ